MSEEATPSSSGRSPLFRNWISLAGVVIAAGSVFSFILLMVLDLFAPRQNPYVGILTWVVSPAFFVLGWLFIAAGWVLSRRQTIRSLKEARPPKLVIDLANPRHRRYLIMLVIAGAVFLLVSAIGSYQTYRATSSVQFCGQACHQPMEPQYVAYQQSPHAKIECTECHIGSGAANFIKAKFNGVHQLYATSVHDFERPIRLSGKITINQKTCEQCHWPERFVGNVERAYNHFLMDETNTPFSVRLLLKVGGADATRGPPGGIHWHMNIANKVEYIATDDLRQNIPWVRLTDAQGRVTEFRSPDFTNGLAGHAIRRMDCMDCHNRPAHQFRSPGDAVDLAMSLGQISRKLPGIKKEALLALTATNSNQKEGLQNIAASLRKAYPDQTDLEHTISAVQTIYGRNFFPEMKTDWRTYPNNIGHKDWSGCFRCHDGQHKTADGSRMIKASDCNACHTILAQGSGEQLDKLSASGHSFFHIDAINEDFSCNNCHTGALPKE
jgi:nitrate/TMAO reductase-like tetraheme cytochrome c subunit